MSSVPVASRLVLLERLPFTPPGTKVRFIGCVQSYDPNTGLVHLQHRALSLGAQLLPVPTTALVDISHEDVNSTDMAVGTWVNVIGYVNPERRGVPQTKVGDGKKTTGSEAVLVQAVMLWNAGAIDLEAYTKAALAKIEFGRAVTAEGDGDGTLET